MPERKHLFNTSEKSDFILNMSAKDTQKLFGGYAIITMIGFVICSMLYYFTKNIAGSVNDFGKTIPLSDKMIFAISSGLTFFGLFGFLMLLIAKQKNQLRMKNQKEFILLGGFVVVVIITSILGLSPYYSFFGMINRSEGLLAFLGYFGLFALGTLIISKKWRKLIADFLVGIGFVQAVVGILQTIKAVNFPSWFGKLFCYYNVEEGWVMADGYAANGFMGTPFALATFMIICFAVALVGAMYDKAILRRILYGISSIVFVSAGILTHTFVARFGIIAVAVIIAIFEIVRLFAGRKNTNSAPLSFAVLVAVVIIAGGTTFAIINAGDGKLLDSPIIYTDTYDRLSISTLPTENYTTKEIYQKLWSENFKIAKNYIFEGIGLECIPVSYGEANLPAGLVDRPYNEYLYILECTGIFGLLFFIAFIIFALRRIFICFAGFFKNKFGWVEIALSVAVLGYLIQAIFNISQNTVTPYYWLVLGMVFAVSVKNPIEYGDD